MNMQQNSSAENQNISAAQQLDLLILNIAKGNRESLAQLYEKTRPAVYSLALSYLKNQADAQDVVQDVFVQVWNCAQGYQAKGYPMAWLMTVTRNMALQKLRADARFQELSPQQWQEIPAVENQNTAQARALLQVVFKILSEQERRIVCLHAVAGLKHREIAKLLELPLATELSKYHRALKKLKAELEGEDEP